MSNTSSSINPSILIELKVDTLTQLIKCLDSFNQMQINYKIIEKELNSLESESKVATLDATTINKKLGRYGQEILELLSKGSSYKEISKKMNISIDGVRYYVKKIYVTLGVSNGREAVNKYFTYLAE